MFASLDRLIRRHATLGTMLGLSEPTIEALYAEGVVHRTEPFTAPQIAAVNP